MFKLWNRLMCLAIVFAAARGFTADLANLPPNTWEPVKFKVEQLAGGSPDEKGDWANVGWNKLVYDSVGKRVLFYDRWSDKKHGGYTIYGNCLFSFDPVTSKVTPLKIDNWKKIDVPTGYHTVPLDEDVKEPTPFSRHVYQVFEFVPDLNSVFIYSGANGSLVDPEVKQFKPEVLKDLSAAWRLDLEKKTWTPVAEPGIPMTLDSCMAYCADTKSLILATWGNADLRGKIAILDIASGKWHKAKQETATAGGGLTIVYDPPRKRMILGGGGPCNGDKKSPLWRNMYAFDPKTEIVTKLANCPSRLCSAPLAYDSKHDVFLMAFAAEGSDEPSGVFCYDPRKDTWSEVKTANPVPAPDGAKWCGWLKMCYDPDHDCFVGMLNQNRFYLFRYVPETQVATKK